MRNVPNICIRETTDSVIRFGESRSVIRFHNPNRLLYKRVQVDGCAIRDGERCDNLLCSADEREERFVELKGVDIPHAIDQLRSTILRIGEHNDNRHCYVICTKVSPHITTAIQKAKKEFRKKYNSDLQIKETPWDEKLPSQTKG